MVRFGRSRRASVTSTCWRVVTGGGRSLGASWYWTGNEPSSRPRHRRRRHRGNAAPAARLTRAPTFGPRDQAKIGTSSDVVDVLSPYLRNVVLKIGHPTRRIKRRCSRGGDKNRPGELLQRSCRANESSHKAATECALDRLCCSAMPYRRNFLTDHPTRKEGAVCGSSEPPMVVPWSGTAKGRKLGLSLSTRTEHRRIRASLVDWLTSCFVEGLEWSGSAAPVTARRHVGPIVAWPMSPTMSRLC